MSDAISNYLENAAMNHLFGKATLTAPTVYLVLIDESLDGAPTDADTGTTLADKEPQGASYVRKATVAGDWGSAASGALTNTAAFEFVEAQESWGQITHVALVDASSGGNMLWYGAVQTPRTIGQGVVAKISAGAITCSFTNGSPISDHARNAILNHIFGKATFTSPSIHLALAFAAPSRTTAGSAISEPSGNGYTRHSLAASAWTSASGGETHNNAAFDMSEATGNWGSPTNVTNAILLDASSNGNVLVWGELPTAKQFTNLDKPYFEAGDLSFTLN